MVRTSVCLCTFTLLLASCSSDQKPAHEPREETPAEPPAVTYQRDLRAVMESHCVECHRSGGIGPLAFDRWESVRAAAPAIVSAVTDRRMPPWPASAGCHDLVDARALPEETVALFATWADGDYAEGDESDYVAPEPGTRLSLGEPDVTLKAAASYTPEDFSDTYRCFYVGSLEQDTYVRALDIVPGAASEVHHVQLHRVEADSAASARALDEASAEGGYPCNSSGVGLPVPSQNMFSYRPGSLTVLFNEGDAAYLKGGSGLVLQIHYNTQFLPQGSAPEPDQTSVRIWTLPEGERPERVIYRAGVLSPLSGRGTGSLFSVLSSVIPAGAERVIGESVVPMRNLSQLSSGLGAGGPGAGAYIPGEIVGMTPHAHGWATRMNASLRPGGDEACLIEVPRWNYEWQLDYMFERGVPYGPDDELHVQCTFDNSADNQPTVNGAVRQPQPVTFGENTLNEMCLHYLWLRFAYADFEAALSR
ncbi:MAG TPA: cytochrome c [Polyangiales bacterium]